MSSKNKNLTPDIPYVCQFCEHAALINDECNVLCEYKGIVNREYKCKKYVYDPLKRVPRTLPPIPKLSEDDVM